jgi:glycosyltransferase involved in cell wall biosynthesis
MNPHFQTAIGGMENNSIPDISVIMAVHNGRSYLPEAIDSILGQTLRSLEFIIIDDGSTDGCSELLRAYSARDSRIQIVYQNKRGLTASLNLGLSLARAPLIARMDGDDISMPDRLEKQAHFLKTHQDYVLVGAEVLMVSPDGLPLHTRGHPREHGSVRRLLLLGSGGALTHPVVMFRRSAIDRIGPFDEEFETTQDLDLFLRLSEIGKAANLSDVLLHWRQHPQSVNRTRSATWSFYKRKAIGKTLSRIGIEQYLRETFLDDTIPLPNNWEEIAYDAGFYRNSLKRGLRNLGSFTEGGGSAKIVIKCAIRLAANRLCNLVDLCFRESVCRQ